MQNTTDFSCKLTDLSHAVHIPDLTSPTASVSVHKSHEIDITALIYTWDYVEQPPKPLLGSWPHEEPTGESWFWASVHSSQTHCLRKGQVRRSPISAQWHVMVSMQTPQPDIFCPALFQRRISAVPLWWVTRTAACGNVSPVWQILTSSTLYGFVQYQMEVMILKMSQIW